MSLALVMRQLLWRDEVDRLLVELAEPDDAPGGIVPVDEDGEDRRVRRQAPRRERR